MLFLCILKNQARKAYFRVYFFEKIALSYLVKN
jgi:hypothetical protein